MTKKTKIINFILRQPGQQASKEVLNLFICNLNGKIYDPVRDRGCWCLNFNPPFEGAKWHHTGYLMKPSQAEPRYIYRIRRGVYGVKAAVV